MAKKTTFSKGVRKHIRTQKGMIRRDAAAGSEEQQKRISDLYAKFGSVRKGGYAG